MEGSWTEDGSVDETGTSITPVVPDAPLHQALLNLTVTAFAGDGNDSFEPVR